MNSFDMAVDDMAGPDGRQASMRGVAAGVVWVRLQGPPRPMTLAVAASLCIHVALMAGAWPVGAPDRPALRRLAAPAMPTITAYIEPGWPILAVATGGLAQVHARTRGTGPAASGDKLVVLAAPGPSSRPDVSLPRIDAPAADQPAEPGPDAAAVVGPQDTAANGAAAPAPAPTGSVVVPPGWGRPRSWGQAELAWQDGARAHAQLGQAQLVQVRQWARQDAADRARGQYELAWRQRQAELRLGGTCNVTFTSGELPTARCEDAADEATLDALGLELGLVPAGGRDSDARAGAQAG